VNSAPPSGFVSQHPRGSYGIDIGPGYVNNAPPSAADSQYPLGPYGADTGPGYANGAPPSGGDSQYYRGSYEVDAGRGYANGVPPSGGDSQYRQHLNAPQQYVPAPSSTQGFYEGRAPRAPPSQHPPFQSFQLSTKVVLENLPLTASPDGISACLFQYSMNVLQCSMEYDNDPNANWCYAHVDLANSEESSRCVALAQQSLLEFHGRILAASIDTSFPPPQVLQAAPPAMYHPPPVSHYNAPSYAHPPASMGHRHASYPAGPDRQDFRRGAGRNRHRDNRRDTPY
jgi:hypothetical protein